MAATFHFYLREERPDKRGYCPIYLRITQNRIKKYINTGISLKPSDWNPDKQQVRRSHNHYNKLNNDLEILRENASQAFRVLNSAKKSSASAIRNRVNYSGNDNFFDLAEEYLSELKSSNQYWSHKQARVAIGKLKSFHGSKVLPVNTIDSDLLSKFQAHLKKTIKTSTIAKNLGAIKGVLQLAVRNHLLSHNPMNSSDFQLVKVKSNGSKTKLTLKQIEEIENLPLESNTMLWHSRNAFVLAFYFCGMRFGDLAELKWSNIKNGRLEYDMNKTGNYVNIPIKTGAQNILNQYKKTKEGYLFPFLSDLPSDDQSKPEVVLKKISSYNAYVNKNLKLIASLAGIDEPISMHVARHSFAQYGVNDKNIPPYKMMMLLGHSNIKTTMQYLKSLDLKTVDETMDVIF